MFLRLEKNARKAIDNFTISVKERSHFAMIEFLKEKFKELVITIFKSAYIAIGKNCYY